MWTKYFRYAKWLCHCVSPSFNAIDRMRTVHEWNDEGFRGKWAELKRGSFSKVYLLFGNSSPLACLIALNLIDCMVIIGYTYKFDIFLEILRWKIKIFHLFWKLPHANGKFPGALPNACILRITYDFSANLRLYFQELSFIVRLDLNTRIETNGKNVTFTCLSLPEHSDCAFPAFSGNFTSLAEDECCDVN